MDKFLNTDEGMILISLIVFFSLSIFIISFWLFLRPTEKIGEQVGFIYKLKGITFDQKILFIFLTLLHNCLPIIGISLLIIDLIGFFLYYTEPNKETLKQLLYYIDPKLKK